jgi:sec-independent protein translocase protein TatA
MEPILANIFPQEILIIVIALVLLFGAKKIPELMRGLGSGIKEFKKAANEIDSDDKKTETKEQ